MFSIRFRIVSLSVFFFFLRLLVCAGSKSFVRNRLQLRPI